MSVIFTAQYEGQGFQVEITRGGDLKFLDYYDIYYDIEYDLAMAEFGEPETNAVKLLNEWKHSPIDTIFRRIGIEKREFISLAADWAEHVLRIFQQYDKDDESPEFAIQAARRYVELIGTPFEQNARVTASAAADSAFSAAVRASLEAAEAQAAWAAAEAAWTVTALTAPDAAAKVASHAAEAMGQLRGDKAKTSEISWQVRRFVDCMEAVQWGQPWPPLGATR